MFGLIMVLLSIAMMSAFTMATITYFPMDALLAHKARTKAREGIEVLSSGAIRYIKVVTDANGVTTLPPNGTDLSQVLQPNYAFIPPAPNGMEWSIVSSFYSGLPAISICLKPMGQLDDATQRGVESIKAQFPSAAMFVSSQCQAQANATGSYVTFWVVANHHG